MTTASIFASMNYIYIGLLMLFHSHCVKLRCLNTNIEVRQLEQLQLSIALIQMVLFLRYSLCPQGLFLPEPKNISLYWSACWREVRFSAYLKARAIKTCPRKLGSPIQRNQCWQRSRKGNCCHLLSYVFLMTLKLDSFRLKSSAMLLVLKPPENSNCILWS